MVDYYLYMDFIQDNPDFAPKAKRTISRTEFYRWLKSFAVFKTDIIPDEGRDLNGRWIIFLTDKKNTKKDEGQLEF